MTDAKAPAPAAAPKLFPRNLTAHAQAVITGNPANSRSESGVDNSYPGLEFDTRNLEQIFFPELRFDYHSLDGAELIEWNPQSAMGRAISSLGGGQKLYLWALFAIGSAGTTIVVDGNGLPGLEIWRRIRKLDLGRVGVMIGAGNKPAASIENAAVAAAGLAVPSDEAAPIFVLRDEGSPLANLLAIAKRSLYLDAAGVIDTDRLAAGELTQSLCAPWMYDFRDCYCYYWAANKPDMVDAGDGSETPVNFMRRNRASPAPADVSDLGRRLEGELTYTDMVEGGWQLLPVVLDDCEGQGASAPARDGAVQSFTHESLVEELRRLAEVEHAILVQYLYAGYALRVPEPGMEPPLAPALRFARQEILQIAKDEMHHFQWVNDLLWSLGARPSTGRARVLQEAPAIDASDGMKTLKISFALKPLTPDVLQAYIDVERPSRRIGQGIDGIYVRLLDWLVSGGGADLPKRQEMAEVIKLIVDEGDGHFRRLSRVQAMLEPFTPDQYLVSLRKPGSTAERQQLALANHYYNSVLEAIDASFALNEASRAELLASSVRTMRNLDDLAVALAVRGVALDFRLDRRHQGQGTQPPHKALANRGRRLRQTIVRAVEAGVDDVDLAAHQRSAEQFYTKAGRLLK